ncbi:hypothetical protein HDU87_008387 [Geranomyces variabilis]|uniref:Uncharacterized protein n=1 Tax=Geranomyces variabilis TaxID=109894 RepID=A0AAD5TDJ8_9FUNG|nr:hypothetical protein HDU87_008387 [Geranomyces variabilis]
MSKPTPPAAPATAAALPPNIVVFSDFDGTIAVHDTGTVIIDACMGQPARRALDLQILAGTTSFRDAVEQMWGAVNLPWDHAVGLIRDVPLDPHFATFHDYCLVNRIPLTVLSSGLRPLVAMLLEKYDNRGEDGVLTIVANGIEIVEAQPEDGKPTAPRWVCEWLDDTPHGHDKSMSIEKSLAAHANSSSSDASQRPLVVFIGDGVSDISAARHADVVLAKRGKDLESWCKREGVAHTAWEDFGAVLDVLKKLVNEAKLPQATTAARPPPSHDSEANHWFTGAVGKEAEPPHANGGHYQQQFSQAGPPHPLQQHLPQHTSQLPRFLHSPPPQRSPSPDDIPIGGSLQRGFPWRKHIAVMPTYDNYGPYSPGAEDPHYLPLSPQQSPPPYDQQQQQQQLPATLIMPMSPAGDEHNNDMAYFDHADFEQDLPPMSPRSSPMASPHSSPSRPEWHDNSRPHTPLAIPFQPELRGDKRHHHHHQSTIPAHQVIAMANDKPPKVPKTLASRMKRAVGLGSKKDRESRIERKQSISAFAPAPGPVVSMRPQPVAPQPTQQQVIPQTTAADVETQFSTSVFTAAPVAEPTFLLPERSETPLAEPSESENQIVTEQPPHDPPHDSEQPPHGPPPVSEQPHGPLSAEVESRRSESSHRQSNRESSRQTYRLNDSPPQLFSKGESFLSEFSLVSELGLEGVIDSRAKDNQTATFTPKSSSPPAPIRSARSPRPPKPLPTPPVAAVVAPDSGRKAVENDQPAIRRSSKISKSSRSSKQLAQSLSQTGNGSEQLAERQSSNTSRSSRASSWLARPSSRTGTQPADMPETVAPQPPSPLQRAVDASDAERRSTNTSRSSRSSNLKHSLPQTGNGAEQLMDRKSTTTSKSSRLSNQLAPQTGNGNDQLAERKSTTTSKSSRASSRLGRPSVQTGNQFGKAPDTVAPQPPSPLERALDGFRRASEASVSTRSVTSSGREHALKSEEPEEASAAASTQPEAERVQPESSSVSSRPPQVRISFPKRWESLLDDLPLVRPKSQLGPGSAKATDDTQPSKLRPQSVQPPRLTIQNKVVGDSGSHSAGVDGMASVVSLAGNLSSLSPLREWPKGQLRVVNEDAGASSDEETPDAGVGKDSVAVSGIKEVPSGDLQRPAVSAKVAAVVQSTADDVVGPAPLLATQLPRVPSKDLTPHKNLAPTVKDAPSGDLLRPAVSEIAGVKPSVVEQPAAREVPSTSFLPETQLPRVPSKDLTPHKDLTHSVGEIPSGDLQRPAVSEIDGGNQSAVVKPPATETTSTRSLPPTPVPEVPSKNVPPPKEVTAKAPPVVPTKAPMIPPPLRHMPISFPPRKESMFMVAEIERTRGKQLPPVPQQVDLAPVAEETRLPDAKTSDVFSETPASGVPATVAAPTADGTNEASSEPVDMTSAVEDLPQLEGLDEASIHAPVNAAVDSRSVSHSTSVASATAAMSVADVELGTSNVEESPTAKARSVDGEIDPISTAHKAEQTKQAEDEDEHSVPISPESAIAEQTATAVKSEAPGENPVTASQRDSQNSSAEAPVSASHVATVAPAEPVVAVAAEALLDEQPVAAAAPTKTVPTDNGVEASVPASTIATDPRKELALAAAEEALVTDAEKEPVLAVADARMEPALPVAEVVNGDRRLSSEIPADAGNEQAVAAADTPTEPVLPAAEVVSADRRLSSEIPADAGKEQAVAPTEPALPAAEAVRADRRLGSEIPADAGKEQAIPADAGKEQAVAPTEPALPAAEAVRADRRLGSEIPADAGKEQAVAATDAPTEPALPAAEAVNADRRLSSGTAAAEAVKNDQRMSTDAMKSASAESEVSETPAISSAGAPESEITLASSSAGSPPPAVLRFVVAEAAPAAASPREASSTPKAVGDQRTVIAETPTAGAAVSAPAASTVPAADTLTTPAPLPRSETARMKSRVRRIMLKHTAPAAAATGAASAAPAAAYAPAAEVPKRTDSAPQPIVVPAVSATEPLTADSSSRNVIPTLSAASAPPSEASKSASAVPADAESRIYKIVLKHSAPPVDYDASTRPNPAGMAPGTEVSKVAEPTPQSATLPPIRESKPQAADSATRDVPPSVTAESLAPSEATDPALKPALDFSRVNKPTLKIDTHRNRQSRVPADPSFDAVPAQEPTISTTRSTWTDATASGRASPPVTTAVDAAIPMRKASLNVVHAWHLPPIQAEAFGNLFDGGVAEKDEEGGKEEKGQWPSTPEAGPGKAASDDGLLPDNMSGSTLSLGRSAYGYRSTGRPIVPTVEARDSDEEDTSAEPSARRAHIDYMYRRFQEDGELTPESSPRRNTETAASTPVAEKDEAESVAAAIAVAMNEPMTRTGVDEAVHPVDMPRSHEAAAHYSPRPQSPPIDDLLERISRTLHGVESAQKFQQLQQKEAGPFLPRGFTDTFGAGSGTIPPPATPQDVTPAESPVPDRAPTPRAAAASPQVQETEKAASSSVLPLKDAVASTAPLVAPRTVASPVSDDPPFVPRVHAVLPSPTPAPEYKASAAAAEMVKPTPSFPPQDKAQNSPRSAGPGNDDSLLDMYCDMADSEAGGDLDTRPSPISPAAEQWPARTVSMGGPGMNRAAALPWTSLPREPTLPQRGDSVGYAPGAEPPRPDDDYYYPPRPASPAWSFVSGASVHLTKNHPRRSEMFGGPGGAPPYPGAPPPHQPSYAAPYGAGYYHNQAYNPYSGGYYHNQQHTAPVTRAPPVSYGHAPVPHAQRMSNMRPSASFNPPAAAPTPPQIQPQNSPYQQQPYQPHWHAQPHSAPVSQPQPQAPQAPLRNRASFRTSFQITPLGITNPSVTPPAATVPASALPAPTPQPVFDPSSSSSPSEAAAAPSPLPQLPPSPFTAPPNHFYRHSHTFAPNTPIPPPPGVAGGGMSQAQALRHTTSLSDFGNPGSAQRPPHLLRPTSRRLASPGMGVSPQQQQQQQHQQHQQQKRSKRSWGGRVADFLRQDI